MNQQLPIRHAPDLTSWGDFFREPDFCVPSKSLLNPDSKIFTMGSCFAYEIRRALEKSCFQIYPNYHAVSFDPTQQIFDKVLLRNAVFHYDTFTMRQEFEEIFGLWTDRPASFCEVRNAAVNALMMSDVMYQDPTRRMVYAKTLSQLNALSTRITDVTREGFMKSDVIVLTLGLTEVWPHINSGRYLCLPPGAGYGGAEGLARFKTSSFMENYNNVRAILDLIKTHCPEKQVVISVSPIHLEKTYTPLDVATASTESKSILRAVAGQIAREYQNVTYYPSFEMAQFGKPNIYCPDGRHVTQAFADRVVAGFLAVFSASPTDLPPH